MRRRFFPKKSWIFSVSAFINHSNFQTRFHFHPKQKPTTWVNGWRSIYHGERRKSRHHHAIYTLCSICEAMPRNTFFTNCIHKFYMEHSSRIYIHFVFNYFSGSLSHHHHFQKRWTMPYVCGAEVVVSKDRFQKVSLYRNDKLLWVRCNISSGRVIGLGQWTKSVPSVNVKTLENAVMGWMRREEQ